MKNTPTKFKLRSGNVTPFKQMGGDKDIDAYNTTVRAEYEAQLQSHSDSTASYNMELEKNKVLVRKNRYGVRHYYEDLGTDKDGNPVGRSKKYNDWKKLDDKQKELGIYQGNKLSAYEHMAGYIDAYGATTGRNDYDGENAITNASNLRPKKKPVEPMEMIGRMKIKNIDMGEPTIPDVLEPSKRKYMTSADGKTKVNLKTGEKTKVKTSKVKKTKKPGKRSVKNLVTGKYNKIQ